MLRVNNLVGFGGAAAGGPVEFALDSGGNEETSGGGGTVHTHSTKTSAGPVTVVAANWGDAAAHVVSGITFDGNAMTEMGQALRSAGGYPGCSLYIINGAQTGDVVITFDGDTDGSFIDIISLTNLESLTPIDQTEANNNAASINLPALTGVDPDGIVLVSWANESRSTTVVWTNATENSDVGSVGSGIRSSSAYALGTLGGTINANGGHDDQSIVGVALR